ncbi:hypothetical protein D3C72_1837150 [compost metagenome]
MAVRPQKISPDTDHRGRTGQVLGPSALLVVDDGHGARCAAGKGLADLRLANRPIDLRLQHACERSDVGMDLAEKQVDAGGGRFCVGPHIVLVGLLQALADFRRGIPRQSLHIPKRKAACDKQIEQHGAADNEHELGAEGPQAEAGT